MPDERLAVLPTHFRNVLTDRAVLLVDREDGLDEDQHERLLASVPEVEHFCEELAAVGILETVQHDDLHDGNVFVRDGDYVVFDWGDSCISHPFHSLVVALRAAAWRFELAPAMRGSNGCAMRTWSRSPCTAPAPSCSRPLPPHTGSGRSPAHSRGIAVQAFPEIEPEQSDSVPYGLRLFLENGPIGTWQ